MTSVVLFQITLVQETNPSQSLRAVRLGNIESKHCSDETFRFTFVEAREIETATNPGINQERQFLCMAGFTGNVGKA